MTANKLALIRFWLAERSGVLGLVLVVCIIVPLVALVVPVGPSEEEQGALRNVWVTNMGRGSYRLAVVSLAHGTVVVRLPSEDKCAIGGPIRVLKQHHLWGPRYVASFVPCG